MPTYLLQPLTLHFCRNFLFTDPCQLIHTDKNVIQTVEITVMGLIMSKVILI